jgi:sugar lactone lactonase YvrE
MTRRLKAELLDPVGAVLGEGPAWDAGSAELVWVDILSGTVYLHDHQGGRRARYDLDGHVSSALPAEEGGWLVTTADGFVLLEREGSVQPLLTVEAHRPEIRFNDAKCDPWGQALAGTMRYDEAAGSATLYRLENGTNETPGQPVELTARILLEHLGLANGLGWSVDGTTMYFIDSLARSLCSYIYSPEHPELGSILHVLTFDSADGVPDGMCVDVEDNLWVAFYGGGTVQRFRPDGLLDTVVSLPVPYPTSVAFGGPRGDRLFITTAGGEGHPDAGGAGGLWAVDTDTEGPPATLWRQRPPAVTGKGTPRV